MENELVNALGEIQASDALRAKTALCIREEINKRSHVKPRARFRIAAVCSALLVIIALSGVSYRVYFAPAAYVDMDVNPSVGLTLNRFDRVINTQAYNDDGAVILSSVSLRFKTYKNAAEVLLEAIIQSGFLPDDGLVAVTVQSGNAEDVLLAGLEQTIFTLLSNHHLNAQTDIFSVTSAIRTSAHEHRVSPAMYLAISALQEVDPNVTFESCAGYSMRQIRERARAGYGGPHHNEDSDIPYDDHEYGQIETPDHDDGDFGGNQGGWGNGRHHQ